MNEPGDRFDLTVAAPAVRKEPVDVRFGRYSPWLLGFYITASLTVPVAAAILGWWLIDWPGVLAGVVTLPIPLAVILWAVEAWLVEHQRLIAERELLRRASEPSPLAAAAPAPVFPERKHLKLGLLQNGIMAPPAARPEPAMQHLKEVCLQLVKLGQQRSSWARSVLAEGEGAAMRGEDWDLASGELQSLDLFEVKAGRGGGLRPKPGREVAETIARLEAAL